jgi:predicted RNA-binding Zn ribbon-like protein
VSGRAGDLAQQTRIREWFKPAQIALVELLGNSDERARLRTCGLASCGSIFLTPAGRRERRWCSMARCGNRAKVSAYRDRAKDAG